MMKTSAFCGGELIANAFTEDSSLSSQRRIKEKNQTTPTNQELKTAETETVILNPCSLLPSGNTNLIWIRHEDTFICLLKALYRVITELGRVWTAGWWTILVLCREAWTDETSFAGTNCSLTFLNQQWAKWVYIGLVLYMSVTFFILLYQLVRNLRAISVTLCGPKECVSSLFLTCALHFLCVYWRLLGIYTRVDSIQSVEDLDKMD